MERGSPGWVATQESKTQTPARLGSAGRQLCEPLPFLAPEEDSRRALVFLQPAEQWPIPLRFFLCKIRRLHGEAFLELTFHECHFPKTPLLWAKQGAFSSYGSAITFSCSSFGGSDFSRKRVKPALPLSPLRHSLPLQFCALELS